MAKLRYHVVFANLEKSRIFIVAKVIVVIMILVSLLPLPSEPVATISLNQMMDQHQHSSALIWCVAISKVCP